MNPADLLSGNAGLAGVQVLLSGQSSRRRLRDEAQRMLRSGYRLGAFHLTRAKFKPGRKLLAYFTFPVLDAAGKAVQPLHLSVAWQKNLEGKGSTDHWGQLQDEANEAGLMP